MFDGTGWRCRPGSSHGRPSRVAGWAALGRWRGRRRRLQDRQPVRVRLHGMITCCVQRRPLRPGPGTSTDRATAPHRRKDRRRVEGHGRGGARGLVGGRMLGRARERGVAPGGGRASSSTSRHGRAGLGRRGGAVEGRLARAFRRFPKSALSRRGAAWRPGPPARHREAKRPEGRPPGTGRPGRGDGTWHLEAGCRPPGAALVTSRAAG